MGAENGQGGETEESREAGQGGQGPGEGQARVAAPGTSVPSSEKWDFGFRRSSRSEQPPRETRVAQNRGSVARRGPKEEGSGREPEERGGRTRLKKQNWAPRDPRAQVTGIPWTAWKCRWQPAPWLSADVRLAPDPHQLLTSGGANAPPAAGTPPGAQRLSGACTLSIPCPAGPARPATSDQRRSALLCAPVRAASGVQPDSWVCSPPLPSRKKSGSWEAPVQHRSA